MALFYDGGDSPSDEVVEADVFQLARMGYGVDKMRRHFNGNVSDDRLKEAIAKLIARGC